MTPTIRFLAFSAGLQLRHRVIDYLVALTDWIGAQTILTHIDSLVGVDLPQSECPRASNFTAYWTRNVCGHERLQLEHTTLCHATFIPNKEHPNILQHSFLGTDNHGTFARGFPYVYLVECSHGGLRRRL